MSIVEEKPRRTRRSFTAEFKRDAAAMLLEREGPIADVARTLEAIESNQGNWVKQARVDCGERDVSDQQNSRLMLTERPASTSSPS